MNRKETHEADGVDRPRPMRRNPLLTLMLGGAGLVLSVSAGQCRPISTDSPEILGDLDEPEIVWPVGIESGETLGWVDDGSLSWY